MRTLVEVWKPVVGYENKYEVSNLGNLRRIAYTVGGFISNRGYRTCRLTDKGISKQYDIHVLVAKAFLGERPKGHVVNHKNGVREDSRIENLEYVTCAENVQHGFTHNGHRNKVGNEHWKSKINDEDVRKIRYYRSVGMPVKDIARLYNLYFNHVYKISTGYSWGHV